ncbi:MAG TPA: DUF6064 family protein [Ramlibacter sp.]|nr:DUF6064 family protein [Ramlibacter sp.]
MSEWWTYRPSSFLMFAPRTYWRLVELYQREVWPLQLLMLAAGVGLLWIAGSRGRSAPRLVCAVLALIWLWVGWAFHWQRYATINWGARYFALAFVVQAVALLALGVLRSGRASPLARVGEYRLGLALAAGGVLAYPLLGVLAGRPWAQSDVFGLMPEPTALATLGLLLAAGPRGRAWLSVIPLLSLALGVTTLWLISG